MKTVWTKGLSEESIKEVRSDFKGSGVLRTRLAAILKERIESNNVSLRSKDAYNISNWAYLQADGVGYERALNEVISLIIEDSVEKQ